MPAIVTTEGVGSGQVTRLSQCRLVSRVWPVASPAFHRMNNTWLRWLRAGVAGWVLAISPVFAEELITAGSAWRFLKGTAEPPADWQGKTFTDASWESGAQPFSSASVSQGTQLADFGGTYTSVSFRRTFAVANPQKVGELLLNVLADDGFVAWLNGTEVARHNVPDGVLTRTSIALDSAPEPLTQEPFAVTRPWEVLVAGDNVLAVQVFDTEAAAGRDFFWNATLTATPDATAPVIIAQVPPPGSVVDELTHVEVVFSEPVTGLDVGDLFVNGVAATNLLAIAPGQFRFDFTPPAAGAVEITFASSHGITDILGTPNAFAGATWTLRLDPNAARENVLISEFVADSYRSFKDEDNDYPDWIELANTGTTDVNLRGWSLTDEEAKPRKWVFGDAILPANGYLVVFASEKDKTNLTARTKLHTNFKLSDEGEYLALVAPDGEIVSAFAPKFPAQRTDVSFGRVPGETDLTGFFTQVTPGARNVEAGSGFAPEVKFSHASGPYVNGFKLQLSAPGAGVVIRYTTNGVVPTNGSPVYLEPIQITNSVEIRARAFAEGLLPGPVHSEGFQRVTADPAHQALFTSTMPILVMSTLRAATITSSRNTFVQFSLHEPIDGRASLAVPPTFTSRGAAKVRGSSTETTSGKSSFAIEWWDEFNEDIDREILGMPADSEWVLYAPNVYDPVMIHNPFIHELSRQLGEYSPRTRFVELYVQRNNGTLLTNQWMGIYVLEEKPSINPNRLDIDNLGSTDTELPDITGGYLLKFDRLDPGDSGIVFGGGSVAAVDPKERDMKLPQLAPQFNYIKTFLATFSSSLTKANWRDPVTGYQQYIDLQNWVDYHIVEVISGNVDSLVLSAYFHKERNGPLKWGPHWDFDRALGSTDGRDASPRNWNTGPFFSATWWSRVLRDPTAWQLWVDRYQLFRQGGMSRSNVNAIIDRFAGEVTPSALRERRKWGVPFRGGSYQSEVNLMKNWLSNRFDMIDRQTTALPALSAPGGRVTPGTTVTLTGPAGATLYYTLDGTDPRLAFGTNEPNPNARIYSGPISIDANSRLVARARDVNKRQTGGPLTTTPWSGPVAATFTVQPPPLAITEIMFHPAPAAVESPYEDEDFEFIELRNVSAETVQLPGYKLSGGVQFTFTASNEVTQLAPNARVLLVANRAAFVSRYPGVTGIAGEYSGRLSNGGDRLTLTGPLGEPVFDFTYGAGWLLLADGNGFSLARLGDGGATSTDPALAQAWRLSGRFGGSPGELDPDPVTPLPVSANVRITEISAAAGKQNYLELEGSGGVGLVNLAGWWLTDDLGDWRQYRLPAGTTIGTSPGGNLLVMPQSQFDQPNGVGFKLDPLGGEIWLLSANADGSLTGFVTGGSYGVSEAGMGFRAAGSGAPVQNFALATGLTPGTPNAAVPVGPVIIRSIHFQPPLLGSGNNNRDEFIELANLSDAPVKLFDANRPALTWRLRGAVELDFPPQLTLPAHGRLLIVGFAPESDTLAVGDFHAQTGANPATPVLGPWRGSLSNEGETVRLQKPAATTLTAVGEPAYLAVEEVSYSPNTPWPAEAAGTGKALVRALPTAFAGLSEGWIAQWPTPGHDDADNDGLPDAWEQSHGYLTNSAAGPNGSGGDPDGDNFTNRMEFINGTDPQDNENWLHPRVTVGARGQLQFHLEAPAGLLLSLESSSSLAPGSWQTIRAIVTKSGNAASLTFEETDTAGKFYRLVAQ